MGESTGEYTIKDEIERLAKARRKQTENWVRGLMIAATLALLGWSAIKYRNIQARQIASEQVQSTQTAPEVLPPGSIKGYEGICLNGTVVVTLQGGGIMPVFLNNKYITCK